MISSGSLLKLGQPRPAPIPGPVEHQAASRRRTNGPRHQPRSNHLALSPMGRQKFLNFKRSHALRP